MRLEVPKYHTNSNNTADFELDRLLMNLLRMLRLTWALKLHWRGAWLKVDVLMHSCSMAELGSTKLDE